MLIEFSPNDYAAKLNGQSSTTKIGPAIILKVMSGDKFTMRVNSWWKSAGGSPAAPNPLTELANALAAGIAGVAGGKVSGTELLNSGLTGTAATSFLNTQTGAATNKPQAFVNWVLLDENFNIAKDSAGNFIRSGYSGFDQVGADQAFTTHSRVNEAINKNGYLYIYVSNQTPNMDVYFDNLQVTHIKGPILEETHYYPFGLTMAGISSKAMNNTPENKYRFNGGNELQAVEFFDGAGLELYDAFNRSYDPQIGRFWQVDELAEASWEESVYSFAHNNPSLFNDPFGLTPEPAENGGKHKELETIVITGYSTKAKIRIYWQLVNTNTDFGRVSNSSLRNWMYEYDRTQKFLGRVHELQREQELAAVKTGSLFVPVPAGWILKLRYARYAANLFRLKRGASTARIWLALSKAERNIVKEARSILNSSQMETLKAAFKKGASAEVEVGGRKVLYSPELPGSGFTLHGEAAFVLGKEAFASTQELGKTVLHELYRLGTQGTGQLGSDATKAYTNAAFEFAEKAINVFKF